MRKRLDTGIKPSEITPESTFLNRRTLLQAAVAAGAVAVDHVVRRSRDDSRETARSTNVKKWPDSTTEKANTFEDITSYNNYYEFGTGKSDPAENAHTLKTSPWSVQVTGEAAKTGTYTLEDILQPHALEERIYRLRCVEAWSMVIPWVGFPLADLLKRFEPTSQAKYVQFFTLERPHADAGRALSRARVAVPRRADDRRGDAPARARRRSASTARCCRTRTARRCARSLPWKYGFKSCKSIVRIHFTDRQPETSWNMAAPQEYGFYSNVNPAGRSPALEPGHGATSRRRPVLRRAFRRRCSTATRDQVASLYTGLDLAKNY